jgi:glycosyltransferase involved in cell wall biosynthesis
MLFHAALSSMIATFGKFDIVHYHASGPSLFAWLPRLAGKPSVSTLHGVDWRSRKWGRLAKGVLRVGEWSACWLASGATCVSLTSQRDLRTRLGANVRYVPNGVARPRRQALGEVGERWALTPGEYVLFVGRLTAVKNIDRLIEAFRGLDTNRKLVIAGGDASDPEHVAALHRAAAGDPRVVFTGAVFDATLAALYSNAALFCLPSASEGMSVALLEAMAYRLPVLVSAIPANLEVIKDGDTHCGLTFTPGSVVELQTALAGALGGPEMLADLAEGGRIIAETRYSWDGAAESMIHVYRELVGARRSPGAEPGRALAG